MTLAGMIVIVVGALLIIIGLIFNIPYNRVTIGNGNQDPYKPVVGISLL